MGIAAAVTGLLAAATIASGHASSGLTVTAVVVRSAAIPLPRRAHAGAGEARSAPVEASVRPEAAASGPPHAVVFTDGAPPAFVVRAERGGET